MARIIKSVWSPNTAGLSRRDRRPCAYEAYVPDRLIGRTFRFSADVTADVAEAEVAISRLNTAATALCDTEALARLLLRAESVASSRIEGLVISARRLLRAENAQQTGEGVADVTAGEVLANINAMAYGARHRRGTPITKALLLDIHRHLMPDTLSRKYGGQLRQQQNWIGGSSYNPCSAVFVPPPPNYVDGLIEDLCEFCNADDLPSVAQAAIAHAQFETIHPFVDGNGRTGRALIHLVLRRRGLTPRVTPPISLVLATWARSYVDGLSATRYRGAATSRAAHAGINSWTGRFAAACTRAVSEVQQFEEHAASLERLWRIKLGAVRANSSTEKLLRALLEAPMLTVKSAAELIDRSLTQTNDAIDRLCHAGILKQVSLGKRNRAFEAPQVIDVFRNLERQLASPQGDTRLAPPSRPVPSRKQPR
jgi:Fic family protein